MGMKVLSLHGIKCITNIFFQINLTLNAALSETRQPVHLGNFPLRKIFNLGRCPWRAGNAGFFFEYRAMLGNGGKMLPTNSLLRMTLAPASVFMCDGFSCHFVVIMT